MEKVFDAKNKDKGVQKKSDEYMDRLREFMIRKMELKEKKKNYVADPKTPIVTTFKQYFEEY